LAAWKDGNARYLVGLVSHNHATSNEERFRCFVYEKINSNSGKYGRQRIQLLLSLLLALKMLHVRPRKKELMFILCSKKRDKHKNKFMFSSFPCSGGSTKDAEYKLAQSGDATCNGLESAEVSF
jgi:hypothetical protein